MQAIEKVVRRQLSLLRLCGQGAPVRLPQSVVLCKWIPDHWARFGGALHAEPPPSTGLKRG